MIGIIGAIIIVIAFMFTSFFKTSFPTSTNFTSPLYNYKYSNVTYPNEQLTVGEIATNDLNIICYHYYTKLLVPVPEETVKKVYEGYMITNPGYKEYEIDHWIPLALGGSNNLRNLWPQPVTYPGYKEKDWLQLYLRDQVCNGKMNLTEAREQITGDWYTIYLNIKTQDND